MYNQKKILFRAKRLSKLGLIVDVLEISTATHQEIITKLKKNDYIYVTGGNTFFLLQELNRSKADKVIIEQVLAGKTYIGESAGSIILSPNIEYVKEMDDFKSAPELQSNKALCLIDFYPLPHYTNFPFEEIAQSIVAKFTGKIELLPFSNTQAISIKAGNIKVVG